MSEMIWTSTACPVCRRDVDVTPNGQVTLHGGCAGAGRYVHSEPITNTRETLERVREVLLELSVARQALEVHHAKCQGLNDAGGRRAADALADLDRLLNE